jgi:glycosyltransferase involved in cell wall biosynthesis
MDLVLTCFLNPSGLSRVAQEYFRLFSKEGFRVIPVWMIEPTPEGVDKEIVQQMLSASSRPIEENPVQLFLGGMHALRVVKKRTALFGSCVFENHILTPSQVNTCRFMDAVLAPSSFCLKACLSSGLPRKKVFKMGYVLNRERWNQSVTPSIPKGPRFRFLFMNSIYERKGLDVLLKAWWQEFTKDDPVELYIKSYREVDRDYAIESYIAVLANENKISREKEPPIHVVDDVIGDELLPSFMKSFDCYVSPHRSEGFGMNPWHAMAIGLPVICTNYGGVTDFAKEDTAWLVSINGMSSPTSRETTIFPHLKGIKWAEPDINNLRRTMRNCLMDHAARTQRAINAADLVKEIYSPDVVLEQFREAIETVAPKVWQQLNWTRAVEEIASQPSPRYGTSDQPIRLVEI